MAEMKEPVIVDAVRTPAGKRGKALKDWHPTDLLAHTLSALVERSDIDPEMVDDVIAGCVRQVDEQSMNIARNAVLGAGFPESVPATTIDRQCGSSQQAAHFAAQGIMSGAYEVAVACGVESMTRVPLGEAFDVNGPMGPWYGGYTTSRYDSGLVNQDFIDSNVFVYLFDEKDERKREIAGGIVESALQAHSATISFQVVQETMNIVTCMLPTPMTAEDARRFLEQVLRPLWRVSPSLALYHRALDLRARYRHSFYDSLIFAAALDAGCTRLYSEDLQDGERIERLTVVNPFREL